MIPLSPQEAELATLLTLQSWGWLTSVMMSDDEEILFKFVAQPAQWKSKRGDAEVHCWDAVPVYLDCSAGKL